MVFILKTKFLVNGHQDSQDARLLVKRTNKESFRERVSETYFTKQNLNMLRSKLVSYS